MDVSEYGEITSIVVSRGGEVVGEEYFDGDADTLRNTRSCTKTVAGMLLGIAIEREIVAGVETPLAELLGEPAPPITLRDLLTMSSCLEYGYLWYLKRYVGEHSVFMAGMGANRVHVFPDRDLVAVITTTNFRRRDAIALSDRLVVEQILGG